MKIIVLFSTITNNGKILRKCWIAEFLLIHLEKLPYKLLPFTQPDQSASLEQREAQLQPELIFHKAKYKIAALLCTIFFIFFFFSNFARCVPGGLREFTVLELDASLLCPGRRDSSCAHWDHTVQLFVCCDRGGTTHCNSELGRWITAFRRSGGQTESRVGSSSSSLFLVTCPLVVRRKICEKLPRSRPALLRKKASVVIRASHQGCVD